LVLPLVGGPVGRRKGSFGSLDAGGLVRTPDRNGGLGRGSIPSGRQFAARPVEPGRDGCSASAGALLGRSLSQETRPVQGKAELLEWVVLRGVSYRVVRLEPAQGSAGLLGAVAPRGRRIGRTGRTPHRGNAVLHEPKVPRDLLVRAVRPEPGQGKTKSLGTTALRSRSERVRRSEPGDRSGRRRSSALGQGRRLRGSERSLWEGSERSETGEFSSRKAHQLRTDAPLGGEPSLCCAMRIPRAGGASRKTRKT
jgi:hypothetical protein